MCFLVIAFKRNRNIEDLIGGHSIMNGKITKKNLEKRQGKKTILAT